VKLSADGLLAGILCLTGLLGACTQSPASSSAARSSGRAALSTVVTSAPDFGLGGNLEGGADLDAAGSRVRRMRPAGGLGAFATTSAFATARFQHTSVAYNGFLYVIGGTNGPSLNDVQVAPINPDGSLGAFVATSSFATARYGHTSVAYNGFLYVIAGYTGSVNLGDVQVARINADGTLGAFTATTALASTRHFHASVAYNGYLYVTGGRGSSNLNDVQVAPFNADGTLGAFTTTTPFPVSRFQHATVAYNGFLYVMGGTDYTSYLSGVWFAPINPNGTLGNFTSTNTFTTGRAGLTAVAVNGALYVGGGMNSTSVAMSDVQVAPLYANGSLGTFTATTSMTSARFAHTSVASNGSLYFVGGSNSAGYLNDVLVAPLTASGAAGALGTFASALTTPTAPALIDFTAVAYEGYLYVAGGSSGGVRTGAVQAAPFNADGTLGTFGAAVYLPNARSGHGSAAYNGFLYVIGGTVGGTFLSDVQVAALGANGSIGPFTATTALPVARLGLTALAYNGFLYVLGGRSGATNLTDVLMAPINSNGTLGAFTVTASLPATTTAERAVIYNGYLYMVGGPAGDILVAPLNANGTVGAFTATAGFNTSRSGFASAASNGYFYVMGGLAGATTFSDVQAAPINLDGTLGAFVAAASLPTGRYGLNSVANNGWLYAVSGYGTTYLADVQMAPLLTPASLGRYSKLLDLGAPATLGSLTANGSATRGAVRLDYRTAPASGVFGSTTFKGALPLAAAVPLTGANVRYLWVRFTLDDTFAATERDLTDFTVTYAAAPSLSPPTATVAPKDAQGFVCSGGSGAGYVYSLSLNNSGGTVNASSGAYVAGPVGSVTDTVVCTDSAAATASSTVTVTAGISVSPASASVPPLGTQAFTASNGSGTGYAWSFAAGGNSSTGTISPAGAYQAGATGNVADILQVTDSLGNVAMAVVNVGPGLSVAPLTVARPPRGTQVFTATGGGTGRTWSTVTNNSGMTIGATTGLYTAGATGGVTDVVGVTDSLGNTATRLITVTGGVSLSPASAMVPPRGTQVFVPDGGSGAGFVWSLPSNASGATLDGGRYVAGATGDVSDVAQATDSLGNSATATITVTAGVTASPPSATVAPRGSTSFGADGGSGTGFVWTFQTNASTGTVSAGGAYTAGATGTVLDVLRVTDSLGNLATVNVTVSPAITVSPASPSTPPNGTVAFTATNGSGSGWAWSLTASGSGSPTINPTSGVYVAGAAQGTDIVRVTDSLGNTASVNVTVTNALSITPGVVSLAPRESVVFTGTGGSDAGYVWLLQANNSGATFNPATAAYQAGATGGVTDTVRLTDSLGNIATATVNVGAGLSVSPAAATAAPKSGVSFTAAGGKAGAKTWSFQTNASGGSIGSSTGAYLAGATGGVTDVVVATDSLGNTGTATVDVGAAVAISPATVSLAPRAAQTLTASGGSNAGFTWSLVTNASSGTLNAGTGAYVAGATGSVTDVVQVTDSLGNVAQRSVSVSAGVTVSPGNAYVAPHGTQLLSASGGSGAGYSWFLTANRSGATLSPTSGLYQAGSTPSVADDVQVVDSLGNVGTATVHVTGPLAITPQLPTVAPRQALAFAATGGAGAVTWRLTASPSGASIDAATGAYVAGTVGDTTDAIEAADASGNVATTQVTVTASLALAPATLSLPPRGAQVFAATGGQPGAYTFSLATNASGATVDPATGAYQAGATGKVTDVVQVTDTNGNQATARVTVTDAVTLSPAAANLDAKAALTFTASGGSGQGFTFSLSASPSGGSIDAATGAYVAGATGGVEDTVQAVDSLGNSAVARVSVGPGAATAPSCGCQSGGSSLAGLWAAALLALAMRRRAQPSTGFR
jgi:hypothetical protein